MYAFTQMQTLKQEVAKTFVDAISTVENAANERIPSSNGKIKNSPWSVISSLCKVWNFLKKFQTL